MSKYEEKMKALDVLKTAIDSVNAATDAIDNFAEKFGAKPEKREKEKMISLFELTDMVADETGMKKECVYEALATALDFISDLGLTLLVKEDEDDDE